MSDAVHIEQGAPPWMPSSTTTTKEVLHKYTIPLVGIIEQQGVSFLFWCVTGHAAPENAWAYARVDEDDVQRLKQANDETFDDALRAAAGEKVCTFAVASDDKGIIESVILHPPAAFDTAHARGMTEMGERFREVFEEYQILRERFPLLREAAHFNLSPSPHAEAV
jgi:hypothetical protein